MRSASMLGLLSLVPITLLVACGAEAPTRIQEQAAEPLLHSFARSEWSEPANLGPPINSFGVRDGNPVLSSDGLSLYYDSDRTDLPGAQGAGDIWVSRRACADAGDPRCAWRTPVNLGPLINTPYVDGSPEISGDGHLLFFLSHRTRVDCPLDPTKLDRTRPCDEDIYVSWRSDPGDDLGWSAPVRLGPEVNSKGGEGDPDYGPNAEPGRGNLYFSRTIDGTARGYDIYSVPILVTRRGNPSGIEVEAPGPAVAVAELNRANALDGGVTIRADGRELFFQSASRAGFPGLDLWSSTRRSPHERWPEPVNLGVPMNSGMADLAPSLSHDGRTLLFTSNRQEGPVGSAGWDIYMSTRTPRGR